MEYDIVIIGAGPAGYVAAIRAGQVGLKTAIIEKENVGGMCLNWGCIPTKAIIESAKKFDKIKNAVDFGIDGVDEFALVFNWAKVKDRSTKITKKLTAGVNYLLKKNGVEIITGEAKISADNTVVIDNRSFKAKNILIATGSKPAKIDTKLDGSPIQCVKHLFQMEEIPNDIVVFGKGVHAIEFAQFFRLIGKTVTLISEDKDFLPYIDEHLQSFILKKLKSDGIELLIGETIDKFKNGHLLIGDKKIKCDKIINCSYRIPIVPVCDSKLELDDNGFIKVDENFETSQKGVYAVGDVNGKSMFAHVASAEGIWLINHLKGITEEFSFANYPINFYTTPEISQIGLTEQQLKDQGVDFKISDFPLSANGKALIEGNTEGYTRILSENKYGQVLGVQIVAAHATDMISEAAAFMRIEGTVYDVAQTIHAHPTVSEVFMEAGFEAVDKAIHK